MFKGKLKLNEPDISLPSIQKGKSTANSPKHTVNLSPITNMVVSLSPTFRDSGQSRSPNEFIVTGLEDVVKQRSKVLSNQASKLNLHHKIATLIKEIEERDAYIRSLETEFRSEKNEANSKKNRNSVKSPVIPQIIESQEGNEMEKKEVAEDKIEILSEIEKNNNRDSEIMKLRKIVEDNQKQIVKLTGDNKDIKKKIKDFNEVVDKSKKIQSEVDAVRAFCKEEVKAAQNKLNELEIELNSHEADMQELTELLKRSEEKRNYSQEYNSYMENNSSKLKDKLVELNTEKQRLEQELKSLQSELIEKRSYSEDLKKKLEQAKAYLDYEKMKNSTLTYNYESMKETLKASNEKNELQRIRHRTEKEKLQKKLDLQGSEKKQKKETLKRKATLQEQNHMTEISKEETARWQAKCNQIEEELQKTHEHIEKLSRTEIYLKNQLLTKDLMISQIEALIKMHEEETLDPPDNVGLANVQSSNIAKLATMIEEIRYQYKKSDDKIKCVSCFKTPQECFLAMPCGHISCQNCKAEFEMICPNCSGKTKGLVRALVVEQIIAHLKRESENIEKAKKILRDQSLNSV